MNYLDVKVQGQRSVRSECTVETNGRTDRRTVEIALLPLLGNQSTAQSRKSNDSVTSTLIYDHDSRNLNQYVKTHFIRKLLCGHTSTDTGDRLLHTATKSVRKQEFSHCSNGDRTAGIEKVGPCHIVIFCQCCKNCVQCVCILLAETRVAQKQCVI